jgi:CBS domain-containing protein
MAYTTPSGALNNTRIVEIIPRRQTVYVFDDAKLGPTLKLMNDHRLTAIPVYRRAEGVHRCLGWFDMRTVMLYLAYGKFKNIATADGTSGALFDRNAQWNDQPVVDLLHLSPENAAHWEYRAGDEVAKLLDPFIKGVHRVIFLHGGSDPQASEVCTQADFVRWIFHCHSAFAKNTDKSLDALGLVSDPALVTVSDKDSALDAFRKAAAKDLHSVGVVDAAGRLVGTVSASDLKALDAEHLRFATLNVMDFLSKYSPKSVNPVSASKQCTLRAVMAKMLQQRVHRVWICDADHKPVAVVSMTDVIRTSTHE